MSPAQNASTARSPAAAGLSALDADILAFIEADDPDPAAFDDLALRLFTHQFDTNAAYRRYCLTRKATPERISSWTGIPAVPLTAFKRLTLATFPPEDAAAVFMTSGSTDPSARGRNHHPHLALYDASLVRSFHDRFLPLGRSLPTDRFLPNDTGPAAGPSIGPDARPSAGPHRMRLLVLNAPRTEAPHSSIAHFFSTLVERFGTSDSHHLVHAETLDVHAALTAFAEAEASSEPLAVLGTSFSFVHLLDAMAAADRSFRLPAGSRVLDTGGFKGRSREVTADDLRRDVVKRLGVPEDHCANYYGMTEISTQYYDRVPLGIPSTDPAPGGPSQPQEPSRPEGPSQPGGPSQTGDLPERGTLTSGERAKVVPHWARLVVVDPLTRRPVPHGEPGLLLHIDLANVGSCMAVLSDDIGRAVGPDPGTADIILRGRAAGAEARGCSLALDEVLTANRAHDTGAPDDRTPPTPPVGSRP